MDSEESEMLEEASDAKRTAEDFQQLYEEVSKEVQAAEGRTPTTDELATAAIRSGFKLEVLKYCFGLRVTLEGLFNDLMEAAVESGNLEMVKCVVEHQAKRIDERADLVAHRNWQQWERVAFLNGELPTIACAPGYFHVLY